MKKILLVLLLLGLALPLQAQFSGAGTGEDSDPFRIATCEQLQEIVNDLTVYYILDKDIDCSETTTWNDGAGFEPIGTEGRSFRGALDGNGFTISNLFINRPDTDGVALFGYFFGAVHNLHLADVDITGSQYVGALIGFGGSSGSDYISHFHEINNCSSSGDIKGSRSYLGGLIGNVVDIDMKSLSSSADVTVVGDNSGTSVGGLIGGADTRINYDAFIMNAYSSGDVSAPNHNSVGGLMGGSSHEVRNSYSSSNVTGKSNLGGLVGSISTWNTGFKNAIINSYSRGAVTTTDNSGNDAQILRGGLIGSVFNYAFTNLFYDETNSSVSSCIADGSAGCTGIKDDASYFFDVANAPMDQWNFTTVWKAVDGSDPVHREYKPGRLLGDGLTQLRLNKSVGGSEGLISFTAINEVPANGLIVLRIPEEFYKGNDSRYTLVRSKNVTGELTIDAKRSNSDIVILTFSRTNGEVIEAGTNIQIIFDGFTFPDCSEDFNPVYRLSTQDIAGNVIDELRAPYVCGPTVSINTYVGRIQKALKKSKISRKNFKLLRSFIIENSDSIDKSTETSELTKLVKKAQRLAKKKNYKKSRKILNRLKRAVGL